ncbi:unnamed protein product [Calicophoron daubneyi]|uniref:TRAF3-interacting protein 1 n=1 Tax=Calicophoron daubneyi TaxID=300641 RepID=A0AAV2SZL6_CALDB
MSVNDVDPKVIKKTQEMLQKIIKKPTLTDKLLSRPPFRFLHDICTAVIRHTGVLKGVFTSDEMVADNVKDKETKLAFLQKLVDYLAIAHGRPVPVRTMSIIAGKEAEKTNEMLVMLAEAVNMGVDNESILEKLQQGEAKNITLKNKAPEVKQATVHGKGEVLAELENGRKEENGKKHHREKAEDKHKRQSIRSKPSEPEKEVRGTPEKKVEEDTHAEDDVKSVEKQSERREKERPEGGRKSHLGSEKTSGHNSRCESTIEKNREETPVKSPNPPAEPTAQQTRIARPPSAKGHRVRKEEAQPPSEEIRATTIPNARLAPPRLRRNLNDSQTVNSSPGARVSGLIIPESHEDSDEDDAQFVMEETIGGGTIPGYGSQMVAGDADVPQDHGGLVTKMLQSKKELETGNLMPQQNGVKQGGLQMGLDEATRQRERAVMEKEISRLCDALQFLSRSALPLGKLMDFVQEDLESMQQEFERWTAENQALEQQLKAEERLTQMCIDPLRAQLAELQASGEEQRKAISSVKAKILQNDERIQDLLSRSIEKVH